MTDAKTFWPRLQKMYAKRDESNYGDNANTWDRIIDDRKRRVLRRRRWPKIILPMRRTGRARRVVEMGDGQRANYHGAGTSATARFISRRAT